MPAQVDHLGCQADDENDKKPSLSSEEEWRIQVGHQRMAVWNTAQSLRRGRYHQQKCRQTEADCFQISGCASQALKPPDPIASEQQHDGGRADDVADWLMSDEKGCGAADQH